MTYEDQHPRSVPQPCASAQTFRHRVELAVAHETRATGGVAELVVAPQPHADRHTDRLQWHAPPAATDHRQRELLEHIAAHLPPTRSGAPSHDVPKNGHQNTSVLFHAPSNTRCRIIPIGNPSNILRIGLRPVVASINTASKPTLTVTLCSARAPPNSPSPMGSTDPTINSR